MNKRYVWPVYPLKSLKEREPGIENLQSLLIRVDNSGTQQLENYNTTSKDEKIAVYFRDLEHHLLEYIREADVVIGCVAWLTSETILQALALKKHVSIIVQKEDFLRPDIASRPNWSRRLCDLYSKLPSFDRYNLSGLVSSLDTCGDPTLDAVRCVGNYNSEKKPAFPRSHHKFVLFCELLNHSWMDEEYEGKEPEMYDIDYIQPYAVWTGSFNFTSTAGRSFENAIVLKDQDIINAFYQEYSQIVALSEPLDWETPWSEPEWRIGT